ncbi:hypothetical protein [Nocardia callitridis]|uniref:Uncharacterized protein n=1 Tax=Nocardia callitridis TaxID=648753 RepID=A0ABP9K6P1_9NOCA
MTVTDHRPTRIAGVDAGTAALALSTCVAFSLGIAALTQSTVTALVSGVAIMAGLALALIILPHKA